MFFILWQRGPPDVSLEQHCFSLDSSAVDSTGPGLSHVELQSHIETVQPYGEQGNKDAITALLVAVLSRE